MKILLVYPYFIEDRIHGEEIAVPPMGLYAVAAVLKENHYDVEILNGYDLRDRPARIEQALQEKRPDVIGFSVLNANRWGAIDIARIARRIDPGVKIVFGGIGSTFLWEHLLTHFAEIDYVVIGEGDYTFLRLIRFIERGLEGGPLDIRGIAFRRKGEILRTGDADPVEDLDELPIPAKYFTYQHLSSSRGCPWNCAFCGSPQFWGPRVRFRSPQHFVAELEMLFRKGVRFFFFSDDTFTARKARVIEICRQILARELAIQWYAISRVDHVDDEVLFWMRRAGCVQISYGIESGSEKIRRRLRKHLETAQVVRAFALTRRYGILPRAYFIYGAPGETWETIQETIDLMQAVKPLAAIFYILDIFPGTALYAQLQAMLGLSDDIWLNRIEGLMYFETDPGLTDENILDFGARLRKAFHEHLPRFVEAIDLVDDERLLALHADFCSRLGMTFSHGDYSGIEAVGNREAVAERLFRKALDYHPDQRAFLGLAVLRQKQGDHRASLRILLQGLATYPESEALNLCLGVSYMNLGEYGQAAARFAKFPDSGQAREYLTACQAALRQG